MSIYVCMCVCGDISKWHVCVRVCVRVSECMCARMPVFLCAYMRSQTTFRIFYHFDMCVKIIEVLACSHACVHVYLSVDVR